MFIHYTLDQNEYNQNRSTWSFSFMLSVLEITDISTDGSNTDTVQINELDFHKYLPFESQIVINLECLSKFLFFFFHWKIPHSHLSC